MSSHVKRPCSQSSILIGESRRHMHAGFKEHKKSAAFKSAGRVLATVDSQKARKMMMDMFVDLPGLKPATVALNQRSVESLCTLMSEDAAINRFLVKHPEVVSEIMNCDEVEREALIDALSYTPEREMSDMMSIMNMDTMDLLPAMTCDDSVD